MIRKQEFIAMAAGSVMDASSKRGRMLLKIHCENCALSPDISSSSYDPVYLPAIMHMKRIVNASRIPAARDEFEACLRAEKMLESPIAVSAAMKHSKA